MHLLVSRDCIALGSMPRVFLNGPLHKQLGFRGCLLGTPSPDGVSSDITLQNGIRVVKTIEPVQNSCNHQGESVHQLMSRIA